MTTNIERFTMSDGNENAVRSWIPSGDVRAVVVLSHGMAEHSARYDRFGCVLAENGIALYAEDHRGHGETAKIDCCFFVFFIWNASAFLNINCPGTDLFRQAQGVGCEKPKE